MTAPIRLGLFGLCLLVLGAGATILRVPQAFPGVQAALDASGDGDTVLVDRGTWPGLLQSPVHSLLLCSQYLFSQDSADIVETVLDGEDAGTILTVNTLGVSLLTVTGFTMRRGRCDYNQTVGDIGGAVHISNDANACFTDMVFADNGCVRGTPVMQTGATVHTGLLTLRRIHCINNWVDEPFGWGDYAINLHLHQSRLIIDGLTIDGGGIGLGAMSAFGSLMDTMVLANANVFNCDNSIMFWDVSVRTLRGHVMSNVKIRDCSLFLQPHGLSIDNQISTISNIEVSHTDVAEMPLFISPAGITTEMDGIHIHHTRVRSEDSAFFYQNTNATNDGDVLRHLHLHDNVHGDSTAAAAAFPYPMVNLYDCDLLDAYSHDNRVIIPGDPEIGETPGHCTINSAFISIQRGNRRVENLRCENNRVEDLDDYSDPSPGRAPWVNEGRELGFTADTMRLKRVLVRHSRQPNHCPEVYAAGAIELSGPGSTIAGGARRLEVEDMLLEDCDDGGLGLWGDTLLMDRVVLKDVARSALRIGQNLDPEAPPYYRLRNVWIDNVDAQDNWLAPQWQYLSRQAVVMVDLVNPGPFWPHIDPVVELDNVTVRGCDGMRHLFNFYEPATLRVRNCLFADNTYGQLAEWDDPIVQDWGWSLLDEWVPGEGIQVGLDPQFDPVLGAPYLSPTSPCIDTGDPPPAWNDPEDPAHPGVALWPALGGLRNDLGYTGGPGAAAIDTSWASLPPWTPLLRPSDFTLGTPWPNPFNPATRVPFTLTRPLPVRLVVHNLLGQEVAVLLDRVLPAGTHQVPFQAGRLASGLYLVTLEAAGRAETRTVTLLR